MELPSTLFSPSSKNEKIHLQKKIVIFYEIELVGSNIKKFQETNPKKIPYTSGNKNPQKISDIFSKESCQEMETPKKVLYIS